MSMLFDFEAIDRAVAPSQDPAARLAERNRFMDKLFREDVERAGWILLRPGERAELPSTGRAIVLGTVLWNKADQELLKQAAELLAGKRNVSVVNLDDVHSPAELETAMPGVPPQVVTPVAAEYEDGVLRRTATGANAHGLLAPVEG